MPARARHRRLLSAGWLAVGVAFLLWTASAQAVAPDATTDPPRPSSPAGTYWYVFGTLNGHNLETSYYFDYNWVQNGVTYQGATRALAAEVSNTDQQVAGAPVPEFPSTTYHYRLVATNADGTAYGDYLGFRTEGGVGKGGPPPTCGDFPCGNPFCAVPQLKGLRLQRAHRRLTKSNCILGNVKRLGHIHRVRNTVVLSQSSPPGTTLDHVAPVRVHVGPKR